MKNSDPLSSANIIYPELADSEGFADSGVHAPRPSRATTPPAGATVPTTSPLDHACAEPVTSTTHSCSRATPWTRCRDRPLNILLSACRPAPIYGSPMNLLLKLSF